MTRRGCCSTKAARLVSRIFSTRVCAVSDQDTGNSTPGDDEGGLLQHKGCTVGQQGQRDQGHRHRDLPQQRAPVAQHAGPPLGCLGCKLGPRQGQTLQHQHCELVVVGDIGSAGNMQAGQGCV